MIEFSNVSFSYDPANESIPPALCNVNLRIGKGEFVAVVGRNGSGKSTLARHINALLLPTSGSVHTMGMDTRDEAHLWEIRKCGAMIFQNPDNQIVASTVEEDVAFGPENLGLPTEEIRRRVAEALATVGMSAYAKHAPHLLSGGQKQRVAIAGAFAMSPSILILDEPTAMLDPSGRLEIMAAVHQLNATGMTIVLVTHFMEEAARAQRVIVMANGEAELDCTPRELFEKPEQVHAAGLRLPDACIMAHALRRSGVEVGAAITVGELVNDGVLVEALGKSKGKVNAINAENADNTKTAESTRQISQTSQELPSSLATPATPPLFPSSPNDPTPAIQITNLTHTYAPGTPFEKTAVKNVTNTIHTGELVGIIGHTGSGKSTLISHLPALIAPTEGQVLIFGADPFEKKKKRDTAPPNHGVGLVFQYPEHQLFESTVWRDVAFGPTQHGVEGEALSAAVTNALHSVGLGEEIWQKSPFELSGGQKRRAAIAGILAIAPRILILDEPTAGLDPEGAEEILTLIKKLHQSGLTVLLVSHSMEALAHLCGRILVMNEGELITDATPAEIFARAEELEKIGLAVPQTTQILNALAPHNPQIAHIIGSGIFEPAAAGRKLAEIIAAAEGTP